MKNTLLITILFFLQISCFAQDTLFLKTGSIFTGSVRTESKRKIFIKVSDPTQNIEYTVKKKKIHRISYDENGYINPSHFGLGKENRWGTINVGFEAFAPGMGMKYEFLPKFDHLGLELSISAGTTLTTAGVNRLDYLTYLPSDLEPEKHPSYLNHLEQYDKFTYRASVFTTQFRTKFYFIPNHHRFRPYISLGFGGGQFVQAVGHVDMTFSEKYQTLDVYRVNITEELYSSIGLVATSGLGFAFKIAKSASMFFAIESTIRSSSFKYSSWYLKDAAQRENSREHRITTMPTGGMSVPIGLVYHF